MGAEINLIPIVATLVFLLLTLFIVLFLFLFQKKQVQNRQEKESIKTQYEQEILTSQLEVQNQTLQNIGRELHDNIGQLLSVAKLNLNVIDEDFKEKNFKELPENILETQNLLGQIIDEVRGLSKSLDGNFVKEFGLVESIANELQRIRKTRKFDTELLIDGEQRKLDFQQEIVLFRITQEIVNNAIKHSEAKKICVKLSYDTTFLQLEIKDNGKGYVIKKPDIQLLTEVGTGLRSIERRANLIGAEIKTESIQDIGTSVKITINNAS